MRQINQWWRPLYDDLKDSVGKDDLPDSTPTLFKVECGLWLSIRLKIPPIALWSMVGMADFIDADWNEEEKRLIGIARYYLSDDRHTWRNALELYQNFEENLRIYNMTGDLSSIEMIQPPSGYTLKRESFYKSLLSTSPKYQISEKKVAPVDRLYSYKVKTSDKQRVTREVYLPEMWGNLSNTWRISNNDQINVNGNKKRTSVSVSMVDLFEIAQFLDRIENISQQFAPRLNLSGWEARLSNIRLQLFDNQGQLNLSDVLNFDGAMHLPGTLSSGKSTLAFLISIWCSLNGMRITLVLNDVSSILSIANDINQHLLHPAVIDGKVPFPKINDPRRVESAIRDFAGNPIAVPILGRTSRNKHISQLYQDTYEEAALEQVSHVNHWGWRWLDTKCALDGLSRDAGEFNGPIPIGQEPCEQLYPAGVNEGESEVFVCPLYGNCPVHQAAKDLVTGAVWITSPAALISSFVSRILTPQKITYYELVYRCSDLVIVDECDQAQSTLDSLFLPDLILAGPGQGHLLNDLAQRVAQMRNDKRSLQEQSSRNWVQAVENANRVTDQIYDILTSPSGGRIRNWIGDGVFWNMNLMALLLWELMAIDQEGATPDQHHQQTDWLNRLARFTSSPLQSDEWGNDSLLNELGQIAQFLVSSGHGPNSKRKCVLWVEQFQKHITTHKASSDSNPRPVESTNRGSLYDNYQNGDTPKDTQYWDSLPGRLEFAILVAILDDQLTLVELEWGSAPETLNLDSYSILRERDKELRPVLPPPPTGRIFGFQYKKEKFSPGAEGFLRRVRFPAMGRWALLHLHDLFLASDGLSGPHVLLLSGTSWSPLSPFFHVQQSPIGILDSVEEKQIVSEWFFKPATLRGKTLSISGAQGDRRLQMLEQVSVSLAQPGGAIDQVLNLIRNKAEENNKTITCCNPWEDRERILILTGSYDEAALVAGTIHQTQSKLKVCQMIRSGENQTFDNEEDLSWINLATQKVGHADVNRFAILHPEEKVLVAPIDAIGRGRNILNKNSIAAFGCIIFVVRSLLPPNDPAADARRLMFWAQKNLPKKISRDKFNETADAIRKMAREEWYRLLTNRQTWADMSKDDREALASTLFTRMWQAVGRGIRGGVPVVVLFVDAKWAPESAKGKEDNSESSLLMAMQECYDQFVEGKKGSYYEQQLANALYKEPIKGLENVKGVIVQTVEGNYAR